MKGNGKMKKSNVLKLTESAIMLAFAVVLSVMKLMDLPYGGSITLCSMLPVIVIAYRHGFAWGLCASSAFALLQLFLGASVLSYATSFLAAVLIILLDYLLAYGFLCIAGVFTKSKMNQTAALALSVVVSLVLRYACHVISGYVVWRDISIPADQAWIYSFGYNASYMLPELIITLIGAVYVSKVLNFRSETITRAAGEKDRMSVSASVFSIIGKTVLAAGAVWSTLVLIPHMQDESGVISITNVPAEAWKFAGIIFVAAIVIAFALLFAAKTLSKPKKA